MTEQASPNQTTLELRSDGGAILHVQDDFDRAGGGSAWRWIRWLRGRGCDRTQNVYFVRYVNPEVDNSQRKWLAVEAGVLAQRQIQNGR